MNEETSYQPTTEPQGVTVTQYSSVQRKLRCLNLAKGKVEDAEKIYQWLYGAEVIITERVAVSILKGIASQIASGYLSCCNANNISGVAKRSITRDAINGAKNAMQHGGIPSEWLTDDEQ
jgi:hypothetical protein